MSSALKDPTVATRRIFVVDDHPMIREGLAAQIANEPGLRFAAEPTMSSRPWPASWWWRRTSSSWTSP